MDGFLEPAAIDGESAGFADGVATAGAVFSAVQLGGVGGSFKGDGFNSAADGVAVWGENVAFARDDQGGQRAVGVESGAVRGTTDVCSFSINGPSGFETDGCETAIGTPDRVEMCEGDAGAGEFAVCGEAEVVKGFGFAPALAGGDYHCFRGGVEMWRAGDAFLAAVDRGDGDSPDRVPHGAEDFPQTIVPGCDCPFGA